MRIMEPVPAGLSSRTRTEIAFSGWGLILTCTCRILTLRLSASEGVRAIKWDKSWQ